MMPAVSPSTHTSASSQAITSTIGPCDVTWWSPGAIDRWTDVWVSPEFRALASRPSWLSDHTIPLLASRPMGWFTPPPQHRFYFAALFMNAVMNRHYDNPLIQDLYVLHEALHAATLDDFFAAASDPGDALRVNEIQVSLETECRVYLRQPEWVGRTFDPLWIAHPSTHINLHSPPRSISSAQEDTYSLIRQRSGWALPPLEHDEALWWARRGASLRPVHDVDATVRTYEQQAVRWITSLRPHLSQMLDLRAAFNHQRHTDWEAAVHNWSAALNQRASAQGALPWHASTLAMSTSGP